MAELQTKLCVEIRVPLQNSNDVKFGSGYTLGPNWVLTAHHILFEPLLDNTGKPIKIDETEPIQITWWDETAEQIKGGKLISVARDDICWWNERYDIALIYCKAPYSDVPGVREIISKERPKERAECESSGFLSNLHNESKNQRRKDPKGTFGKYNPQQDTVDFAISDISISIEEKEYWAGFSGSPIFAEGKLTALVRTSNEGEKNGLTASLISPALDSNGDGRNQATLWNVLCSSVHRTESPHKPWPPMRIRFPEVDGAALETNLECRWGLWRLPLIGILSEQAGEKPKESGEKLNSVLCHVEEVLTNAQRGLNLRLPHRSWHLLNVSNILQPPRSVEELKAIVPDIPDDIATDDIIPGLILVFEVPETTNSWFESSYENDLEEQVKEWLDSLIKIFLNQQPAIICLVPDVDKYLLAQLANDFSDISIEWLDCLFSSGEKSYFLQRLKHAKSAEMNTSPKETLRLFKQFLAENPLPSDLPFPSLDAVFSALKALDNEVKRKEFWDLLKYSEKVYIKLSERLIINLSERLIKQAASSEDVILADIALRFASCSDQLVDIWLRYRLKSHDTSLLDPWLNDSYPEINFYADSSFGESFVDDLTMGVARLLIKKRSNALITVLTKLEKKTAPHTSKIIKAILKEKEEKFGEINYSFQLFENIKDTICGCRCNLLEQFLPSSFASLEVSEDDELPFWLILSHRPDESRLRAILKSCPSVRAVFGLLTDQEVSSITMNQHLVQTILNCRRANRFSPTSIPMR